MDLQKIRRLPILGIMRGIGTEDIAPLTETTISSGLETIEIAMNTPGAAGLIRKAVRAARGRVAMGAGTVLDMDSLKAALDAGATFIVMPALIKDVAGYCAKKKIPFFPGALTPQEIYDAWSAGAAMVKIFPAGVFGPGYIREVKAPFGAIELLVCGGVTPANMMGYFASGASAVAFGASVFRKERLGGRDFASIGKDIRAFVNAYRRSR